MSSKEKLNAICWHIFEKDGYKNPVYKARLEKELFEAEKQMKEDYFLNLFFTKTRFAYNENNLFIAKILRLVDDFELEKDFNYIIGELPDADIDYIDIVRDYLRNEWAPAIFGAENICAIGNYTTFGIKSALLDVARVYSKDRNEVLAITTKMGLKDDDGDPMTWDSALEIYPILKKYCEDNPDVADGAQRLLHRNRGSGTHAAGLVISNKPVNRFIPLIRGKDGCPTSAFVEGLHGQDLGPLGLIKFDLLSIINLIQIAYGCKLAKERHNLSNICALPNQSDWSDDSYLEDPQSLAMANTGKLRCVFQFDSKGIREIVKAGGVTSFTDLPAYSSLFRPGPMQMQMHTAYVKRKQGIEEYTVHPLLEGILGPTYNVLVFQEQIQEILRVVGEIPAMHTEIIRKAISKKKVGTFGKYKEMFITNGQRILGWSKEQVSHLWDQIEAFSGYGFNKCCSGDTLLFDKLTKCHVSVKELFETPNKIILDSFVENKIVEDELLSVFKTGVQDVFEVEFSNRLKVKCTLDHKFICTDGLPYTVADILEKDLEVIGN